MPSKQPKPMPQIMSAPDPDAWVSSGSMQLASNGLAPPAEEELKAVGRAVPERPRKMTFVIPQSYYRALVLHKVDSGRQMQDLLEEAVAQYLDRLSARS